MHRPPVDSVDIDRSTVLPALQCEQPHQAPSRDRASERPASPEVEAALMEEPFESSNEVRLSTEIVAISTSQVHFS